MRTLILSDIHLGSRNCNSQALLQLLETERFDRLILNGDTVNSVNLKKLRPEHWQILARLRSIGKSRELIVIRGNHDHEEDYQPQYKCTCQQPAFRGQQFAAAGHESNSPLSPWGRGAGGEGGNGDSDPSINMNAAAFASRRSSDIGMGSFHVLPSLLETAMLEEYLLDVGDQQYLVLHGDRFDPTLRYPVVTEMADWCYQVSQKISRKLAKWLKKKSKRWGGLLDYVRQQTIAHAVEREHPGIVTGHTHYAEDLHINGVHYLNSGCWTDDPCSYLALENGKIRLRFFST